MGTPDWVRRVVVDTGEERIDYVVADDPPTVVWLANLAALELHVPQWTVGSATPRDGVVAPGRTPSRGRASRWPTGSWSTSTPGTG